MSASEIFKDQASRMLTALKKHYGNDKGAIVRRLQDGLNIPFEQARQMLVAKELNTCHEPGGSAIGGQFCSDPSGGPTPTIQSGIIRIGVGSSIDKPWAGSVLSFGNPVLKMFGQLEVSDKPTDYHIALGEALASKFPGRITPQDAAEQIRQASQMAYDAIPVGDRMSKNMLATVSGDTEVDARIKSPASAVEKLLRKSDEYSNLSQLNDMIGMRIVTKGENALADREPVLAMLKSKYNMIELDDSTDKVRIDGYRAINMVVEDRATGQRAEIQLKTENQQTWSDWSHDRIYKSKDNLTSEQVDILKQNRDGVELYAKRMSDHMYAKDTGAIPSNTAPPECPDYVSSSVGCL